MGYLFQLAVLCLLIGRSALPLSVTKVQDLQFGTSAQGDGGVTVVAPASCSGNAACFTVSGVVGAYTVSIAPSPLDMTGPGTSIQASSFTTNPAAGSLSLDATGNGAFTVGAQHGTIGGTHTTGSYSGSFTVTVTQVVNANTTATANKTIVQTLEVSKAADLTFGDAAQSDPAKTIAPGGAGGASFAVSGEPNRAYTITLPLDSTVVMTTGAGNTADLRISVDSFASTPAQGANGLLDGAGLQTLTVEATRAAIRASQVAGSYGTTFQVTVTY